MSRNKVLSEHFISFLSSSIHAADFMGTSPVWEMAEVLELSNFRAVAFPCCGAPNTVKSDSFMASATLWLCYDACERWRRVHFHNIDTQFIWEKAQVIAYFCIILNFVIELFVTQIMSDKFLVQILRDILCVVRNT